MSHAEDAQVHAQLARLEILVGEWEMEACFPGVEPTGVVGRSTFFWTLGGQFLAQRSEIPHPAAPSSRALIGAGPDGRSFTQHYFDSRGVARVYAMTFTGRRWTLLRDTPDFTPLSFSQRFVATVGQDAIRGRWETSRDGTSWTPDFDLVYTRIG